MNDRFAAALEAYNAGRLDEAAQVCEAVLGSPGGGDLRYVELLGGIRIAQNRPADAVGLFDLQLQHAPQNSRAHFNRGFALARLARHGDAIEALRKALALDPTFFEATLWLGTELANTGKPTDFREARALLAPLTEQRPESAAVWFQYGRACLNSTMETEGERAIRKCLDIDPNFAPAYEHLANQLLETGRIEEAVAAFDKAVELVPTWEWMRRERDRLRERLAPAERANKLARYPRTVRDFDDVQRYIEKYVLPDLGNPTPLISEATRVFTMGSCFAQNIAGALTKCGVTTEYVWCPDDINSTYANRALLEWVIEGPSPKTMSFETGFGEPYRGHLNEVLRQSPVVIISLGVAPCFFDRKTGEFVNTFGSNLNVALNNKHYKFRTTTAAENVENLRAMIRMLRTLNSTSSIFLTVSPVPLRATFERGSAVVADCVSKSTMRVAAHELMSEDIPGTYYWPSFEMVRWYGGHAGPVFGIDDESPFHVSQQLVETIMYNFVKVFGSEALLERAERQREGPVPEPAPA